MIWTISWLSPADLSKVWSTPRDVEKVEKDIERQISSGTNVFDYVNYRILTKEGTEKTVEEFGHLIHVPGGRTPPPA